MQQMRVGGNIMGTGEIMCILFLIAESVEDIKRKMLDVRGLIMWAVAAFALKLMSGTGARELIISLIPGMVILFIGFISREGIGYGDGVVILICGIFCGIQRTLVGMMIAFLIVMISGLFALALRKPAGGSIPFVPLILIGFLGGLCI